MAKQKGKELVDRKPEEETGRSKKDDKEETKTDPPGLPPIGLIELVKICVLLSSDASDTIFCSSSSRLPSMPSSSSLG